MQLIASNMTRAVNFGSGTRCNSTKCIFDEWTDMLHRKAHVTLLMPGGPKLATFITVLMFLGLLVEVVIGITTCIGPPKWLTSQKERPREDVGRYHSAA